MKADKTPREDVRTAPYKQTPQKAPPEPEIPRDAAARQLKPYRLTFFPPHKGKTFEQLEQEGNGRVIDWIKKKDFGAKYPGLKEVLEKWDQDRASYQPAAVVAQHTAYSKEARTDASLATQRPLLPNTATPQLPSVLPCLRISTPVTTSSERTTLPSRPNDSSPSVPFKSTATHVFSDDTNLAQPSSPTSQSTLSTATIENDGYDYDNQVELDFEDYLMPFGKHKGYDMGNLVPLSYIHWLVNTGRCSEDLLEKLSLVATPTETVPGVPTPGYKPPELGQAPPMFKNERNKFPLKIMGSDATEYFCLSSMQLETLRFDAVKPIKETKPTRAQYWLYHVYSLLSALAPKSTADEALKTFLKRPHPSDIEESMAPGGDKYDYDSLAEFASYEDYRRFLSEAKAKKKADATVEKNANMESLPGHPAYRLPSTYDAPDIFRDGDEYIWITHGDAWKYFKLAGPVRKFVPTWDNRYRKSWLYHVWDVTRLTKGEKFADFALLKFNREKEEAADFEMAGIAPSLVWREY